MKDAIGGYFSLELRNGKHYHTSALKLNSARSCFEYILRVRNYKRVYIPYYTCQVLLEPLHKLGVSYEFYAINEQLDPATDIHLQKGDALLYTNYYGLKQITVERLAQKYGKQLIVDNAQAFFSKPIDGIDTFYSPRKFVGVPDGGYLYIDQTIDCSIEQDHSAERMSHLLKRIDYDAETGYADFGTNDDSLSNHAMLRMSALTESLLKNIDYVSIINKRKENYQFLEQELGNSNCLRLYTNVDSIALAYPYLTPNGSDIRRMLQTKRIYVATYWLNVAEWNSPAWEQNLVHNLLPLPIDQRYGREELKTYVKLMKQYNG